MSQQRFSQAYIQHLQQGPFPGKIDPWSETGRYFHAIHGGMIDSLLDAMQNQLMAMGYMAGRETSLQVVDNRQPDIYIEGDVNPPARSWNYEAAASAIEIEPGTALVIDDPELDAIMIRSHLTGELVTVIEIISPRNKTHQGDMQRYIRQRMELFLSQGVNVVEIDCTRSVQRLLNHDYVYEHPYHIVIYIPDDLPRVLVSDLLQPMKVFALPLREEVIAIETQLAYDRAYKRSAIAGKIWNEQKYSLEALPFPSTLTGEQKQSALETVRAWQQQLERLREDKS